MLSTNAPYELDLPSEPLGIQTYQQNLLCNKQLEKTCLHFQRYASRGHAASYCLNTTPYVQLHELAERLAKEDRQEHQ
jgi:hypothetical protein